jgi:hypothetical protein
MTFHEILIPVLAIVVPCISLFIGRKFERGEKQQQRIIQNFDQINERLNTCELKLERIAGRLNGKG